MQLSDEQGTFDKLQGWHTKKTGYFSSFMYHKKNFEWAKLMANIFKDGKAVKKI